MFTTMIDGSDQGSSETYHEAANLGRRLSGTTGHWWVEQDGRTVSAPPILGSACPTCGARPGTQCEKVGAHWSRVERAEKAHLTSVESMDEAYARSQRRIQKARALQDEYPAAAREHGQLEAIVLHEMAVWN